MKPLSRLFLAVFTTLALGAHADSLFDFAASTPEGSWAKRETVTTDHRGRETVAVVTQKFLGSEERAGQRHYWLEMAMDSYRVKQGERRPQGDHMVMKVLVDAELMAADSANVVNNLQGFGKEIIVQSGNADPIRVSEAGGMAGAMMNAFGTKANFDYADEGMETVETPAGRFQARRISGTGSVESKVMMASFRVDSETTTWVSEDVPFGIVRQESADTVNGKAQRSETVLLEFATSGAQTEITRAPTEMPKLKLPFQN